LSCGGYLTLIRSATWFIRADIWAFGCVLFQIIAGRPPFRGATEYLTFQKVLACEYEFPEGFDPAAKSLIERILVRREAMSFIGVQLG
jgi:3-phosphoinositide dependent protein kinase-1